MSAAVYNQRRLTDSTPPEWLKPTLRRLRVQPRTLVVYLVLYFCWGLTMHHFGGAAKIARFAHWWQVITCYLLYMVPISLLLRGRPWHLQYAYGMVAMAFLEFLGYWLGTSIAFDDNQLDRTFGVRNFSLGMTIFFGAYFPIGNWAVATIDRQLGRQPLRALGEVPGRPRPPGPPS